MRKKLLSITALLFFVIGLKSAMCQEKEYDYKDGTKLYCTVIDSTVNQMHQIHVNFISEFSYFRPDKKFLVSALADYELDRFGVHGYYFLAAKSKIKQVDAQAKEQYAGSNTKKVYLVHLQTEKKIFFALHGGLFYNSNPGGVLFSDGSSGVPEIDLGVSRVMAWGIKYLIKDPASTRKSVYTIIAQRIATLNFDFMFYPSKPTNISDPTETYNTIGERLYFKGFFPMLSQKDIGFFYTFGIQNGVNGVAPLIGFGFCGGWE